MGGGTRPRGDFHLHWADGSCVDDVLSPALPEHTKAWLATNPPISRFDPNRDNFVQLVAMLDNHGESSPCLVLRIRPDTVDPVKALVTDLEQTHDPVWVHADRLTFPSVRVLSCERCGRETESLTECKMPPHDIERTRKVCEVCEGDPDVTRENPVRIVNLPRGLL